MFVAIRYMQHEVNAIAELVGPFEDYVSSNAWIRQHWADYDPRDCESYEIAPPFAMFATIETIEEKESDDDKAPF